MGLILVIAILTGTISVGSAILTGLIGPRARARRRLRQPTVTLADREVVTLVGKVQALDAVLTAPLSGRDCVAFEATAMLYGVQRTAYMKASGAVLQRSMTAFALVTDSMRVIVDGESAEIALSSVPIIPRSIDRELQFLELHGHGMKFVKNSIFGEAVVLVGDRITVQGMAVVEYVHDDPERGYRDAPTRVRLVAHPQHPLTIGKPR